MWGDFVKLYIKKLVIALSCSVLFCAILTISLSAAFGVSNFTLVVSQDIDGVADNSRERYSMEQGAMYWFNLGDSNNFVNNIVCNVNSGKGSFVYNLTTAYYMSSDTSLVYDYNFYFSVSNSGFPETDVDMLAALLYSGIALYYSDGSSQLILPRFSLYTTYGNPSYDSSLDMYYYTVKGRYDDLNSGKLIERVRLYIYYDGLVEWGAYDEPCAIQYNYWELGDFSLDVSGVEDAKNEQAKLDNEVAGIKDIIANSSLNNLDLNDVFRAQDMASFSTWVNYIYGLPILSGMASIVVVMSVFFFLLKKR